MRRPKSWRCGDLVYNAALRKEGLVDVLEGEFLASKSIPDSIKVSKLFFLIRLLQLI